jgi:hypothetical protein
VQEEGCASKPSALSPRSSAQEASHTSAPLSNAFARNLFVVDQRVATEVEDATLRAVDVVRAVRLQHRASLESLQKRSWRADNAMDDPGRASSSSRACGIELIVPSLQRRISRNVRNITMHVRCASDRKDERTWHLLL